MSFPLFGWFCAAAHEAQKLLREVKSVILFHGDCSWELSYFVLD